MPSDDALAASADALLTSHDDTLASSGAEVGQDDNDNDSPVPSSDDPDDDALESSDLRAHQGGNADGDLALSDIQVHQGGNDDGALASSNEILPPYYDALASPDVHVAQGCNGDGTCVLSDDELLFSDDAFAPSNNTTASSDGALVSSAIHVNQ